jgi:hypothetical protein
VSKTLLTVRELIEELGRYRPEQYVVFAFEDTLPVPEDAPEGEQPEQYDHFVTVERVTTAGDDSRGTYYPNFGGNRNLVCITGDDWE